MLGIARNATKIYFGNLLNLFAKTLIGGLRSDVFYGLQVKPPSVQHFLTDCSAVNTNFEVFGLTRLRIKPDSNASMADKLSTQPIARSLADLQLLF